MANRKKKAKAKSKKSSSKRVAKKAVKAKKAAPKKAKPAPKKVKKAAAKKAKPAPKKASSKAVTRNARPVVRVSAPRPPAPLMIPELPEVEGYVRSLPPPVKPIVNMLRKIVRDAAPEAHEIYMGGPAYAANGLFARIEAHDREVLIRFLKGSSLDAPEAASLEGQGAERHMTVHDLTEVKEAVLKALVRQAVMLNLRTDIPPPPPPEALEID